MSMFTVVIPVYNHARYLGKAVSSALASPLVDEILLCDDGSSDESPSVVRELALAHPGRIRDLSDNPPRNKGAHVRLNELCRAATRPWIAVLNSDDIFAPHRFETAELLIRATNCEFLSGGILIIDQDDNPIGGKRGIADPEFPVPGLFDHMDGALDSESLASVLCNQNILATTSNMLFSRELFRRIGGFADLRYSHDWDFALRATRLARCLWTPAPLTLYRIHSSNTIKEVTPHLKGETTRFFCRLLHDFPELEQSPLRLRALRANPYFEPYAGPVPFRGDPAPAPLAATPPAPVARRLANAALSLAWFDLSFLLIAKSLRENPETDGLRLVTPDNLRRLGQGLPLDQSNHKLAPSGPGRLLRLPGSPIPNTERWLPSLTITDADAALRRLDKDASPRAQPDAALLGLLRLLVTPPATARRRPRCLVLPAFFAVGGVERNTVEIIRELRSDHDFLVVSTEPHAESQGSLAHQLDELDVPFIDLAEAGDRDRHLDLLACIKDAFRPDIVWICNGSPWLVENASALRRLFASAVIVDQQVYDIKEGWIAHYHRPGIQAADRFIAINRRIHEKFVRDLRIPRHRVRLIYSAVSADRIIAARMEPDDRLDARAALGIPETADRAFAFVARLNPQKRPLRFLDLARRARTTNPSDVFLLVGGGELEDETMAVARAEGLTNLIRIPYSSNTPRLLASVDALVMTSAFEGLPIVLIESLGVGTPAFCTDAGDIGDLLQDTRAGATVPVAMNEDDAWNEFLNFRENLAAYKSQALASRDEVLTRFSSTRIAEQYRTCFTEALAENHSQATTEEGC